MTPALSTLAIGESATIAGHRVRRVSLLGYLFGGAARDRAEVEEALAEHTTPVMSQPESWETGQSSVDERVVAGSNPAAPTEG